jgi:hypothetical protein
MVPIYQTTWHHIPGEGNLHILALLVTDTGYKPSVSKLSLTQQSL